VSLRLEPDLHAQAGPQITLPVPDPFDLDPASTEWALSEWALPDATGAIRVTAVLVAHDGAAFLPRTLDAIDAQTRRPDHLIAVDAGSLDGGGDLLTLATGRLLRLNRDTSFGDAVQAALTALDGTALAPAADPRPELPGPQAESTDAAALRALGLGSIKVATADGPTEWLWLLHDDSAPAADALELLIEAVDGGPSIGIAGCKQVSWDDGRRLLDVGFTTSRLGARVTGIDVDDVDQGQLDHRSDVLAVGTAGMLVRRDVWDRLGGTDPALAHARDDLDLCRRAHLAGLRVVVVPRAVIAHAAATATGRRGTPTSASWALRDRRAAVHLRLASVPLLWLPFLVLWLAGAAVLRALGRLALKQPDRAVAELVAFGLAVTRPLAWMRARRRVRADRDLPRRDFRRLLAGTRAALRQRRDAATSYLRTQEEAWAEPVDLPEPDGLVGPAAVDVVPHDGGGRADLDNENEDDAIGSAFDDERVRPSGPAVTRIGFAVAALVGIVGLIGLRLLLRGSGIPIGPALLPAPETAGQLWNQAMSDWRPTGLGRIGEADPFDAVLALIAAPLAGSTRVAVELLLLGALPLAALSAWWAAGGVTRSRSLRAWAALGWAAQPTLLAAVAAGRLGAIVAHLVLPPAALALAGAVGARPPPAPGDRTPPAVVAIRARGSISAASAAGLLLTVLIAAAPALALPVAVVLLAVLIVARPARALLGWVVVVPAALLLPWWLAVARDPWLLLAEPGGASATDAGTTGWPGVLWPSDPAGLNPGPVRRLAGYLAETTSFADAAFWLRAMAVALVVPLVWLGLSALARRDRARPVTVLWIAGLAGLAIAVLVPLLDVRTGTRTAAGEQHGWPGPGVSLLALAVLAAVLVRLDGAAARLRARSLGSLHWLAVGSGVVAVLAPMIVLAGWAVGGWNAGPDRWVHRGSADVLPAVATAEAQGPAATRTLVLRLTPTAVRWSLYRTGGPRIGQDSAATLSSGSSDRAHVADRPVLDAIGGLLSDSGRDQRDRLADLDIGSILLLAPASDAATVALDTAPGLIRVATPNGGVFWRVELDGTGGGPSRPARVRVLSAGGQVVQTLPSTGIEVHTGLGAGPSGRTLVLAERADPGWRARLDGVPLVPTTHAGWAQAFELPPGAGTLTVEHTSAGAGPTDLGRLAVAGLALLVAVPLPRRRPRLLPPPRARRPGTMPGPTDDVGRRTRVDAPIPAPASGVSSSGVAFSGSSSVVFSSGVSSVVGSGASAPLSEPVDGAGRGVESGPNVVSDEDVSTMDEDQQTSAAASTGVSSDVDSSDTDSSDSVSSGSDLVSAASDSFDDDPFSNASFDERAFVAPPFEVSAFDRAVLDQAVLDWSDPALGGVFLQPPAPRGLPSVPEQVQRRPAPTDAVDPPSLEGFVAPPAVDPAVTATGPVVETTGPTDETTDETTGPDEEKR
jgi:GT2 family glycosyltransferase